MATQKKNFEEWFTACEKEAKKRFPDRVEVWDVKAPGAMVAVYRQGVSVRKAVAMRFEAGDAFAILESVVEQTNRPAKPKV